MGEGKGWGRGGLPKHELVVQLCTWIKLHCSSLSVEITLERVRAPEWKGTEFGKMRGQRGSLEQTV